MTKHIISSEYTSHEVRNLREGRRYEFWVTASTSIGEGQSTKVVSQTPGPNGENLVNSRSLFWYFIKVKVNIT